MYSYFIFKSDAIINMISGDWLTNEKYLVFVLRILMHYIWGQILNARMLCIAVSRRREYIWYFEVERNVLITRTNELERAKQYFERELAECKRDSGEAMEEFQKWENENEGPGEKREAACLSKPSTTTAPISSISLLRSSLALGRGRGRGRGRERSIDIRRAVRPSRERSK